MKANIEKLLKEINSDLDEITKLSKSYSMRKAEEDEMLEDEESEIPSDDEMPADEEAPAEEGFDASSLSDEELFSMVEQLMAEIEGRQTGDEGNESPSEFEEEPLASSVDEDEIEEDLDGDEENGEDEIGEDLSDEMPDEGGEDLGDESVEETGDSIEEAVEEGSLEEELAQLDDEDFQALQDAVDEEAAGRGDVAEKAIRKAMCKVKKMRGKGNPEGTLTKSKRKKKPLKKSKKVIRKPNLKKSVDRVMSRLERLEKAAKGTPTKRYASGDVRVLEKSSGVAAMNGPQIANHLLAEQRKGNKLVKSILVARANNLKEESEVENFYSELEGLGISLPRK